MNAALLSALRSHRFEGRVALRAHDSHDAEALKRAGADVVLDPFQDGAREAVDVLTAGLKKSELPCDLPTCGRARASRPRGS